ncbi:MAG: glycosyltransferase family 2 protein [Cyanobacteria bacterium Co-bin13]|nr:glycosyltransferase family 2 protein [Cyanobacteria bacterium Co-bin13]
MPEPLISVIICTHNRAAYLGAAVDSLLAQAFEAFEVLVVDNASTDGTRQVVEQRLGDARLRYVYEPVLGLSVARNRGAAEAQAGLLAYLDDDAEASTGWLTALQKAFAADPQVAIAGGKVTLLWPPNTHPPRWLSPALAGNLGAYDLGDLPQPITQPGLTPRGLNYAIRQSFLQQVGGFDPQLGRVGKNLLSNEELHMTQQALKRGLKVLYLPEALVAHQVAPERLTPGWFLRRSWWQGISEAHRESLDGTLTANKIRMRAVCLLRGLYKAVRYWSDLAQRFDNLVYAYGQLSYVISSVRLLSTPPSGTAFPNQSSVS